MSSNLGCVIVAVDGSEESMDALRWAIDNLKLRSPAPDSTDPPGSFIVLHVQPPPTITAGLNPGAIPFGGPRHVEVPAFTAAIEAHQRRITQAIVDHALKICSEKNAKHNDASAMIISPFKVNVKTEVVVGDAKEKVCELVEKLHADLLVMGSHTFGPIKRMFLGSVSNYCTNHAQCPVVVVKGKGTST